jgi:general secretion pathway protein G
MMKIRSIGFTLIELLVVMAIVATLLALVAPRYFGNVDKAKETVLKENLSALRDALDKHYSDTGKYPAVLEDLVTRKYLRKVPIDPITDNNIWLTVPPDNPEKGVIRDVHSAAPGKARDGSYYKDW